MRTSLTVPDDHQRSIENHDSKYISILNGLFEEALATTESTVDDSPFSDRLLRWLKANSNIRVGNALSELLLHPHVRSFRTRAAFGQRKQHRIFDILETFPLNEQGEGIPNVVGIYLLYGPRIHHEAQIGDLIYVGQTLAMRSDPQRKGLGIGLRSTQHWKSISQHRASLRQRAELPARSHICGLIDGLRTPNLARRGLLYYLSFPFRTQKRGPLFSTIHTSSRWLKP